MRLPKLCIPVRPDFSEFELNGDCARLPVGREMEWKSLQQEIPGRVETWTAHPPAALSLQVTQAALLCTFSILLPDVCKMSSFGSS